jgi:hypothetical protein
LNPTAMICPMNGSILLDLLICGYVVFNLAIPGGGTGAKGNAQKSLQKDHCAEVLHDLRIALGLSAR